MLLDQMGLDKRDADGFRLDGETFVVPFEITTLAADFTPVTELVIEHWRDVRIKATMNVMAFRLWFARTESNELKAAMFWNGLPKWMGYWPGASVGRRHIDRFTWPEWYKWWNTSGESGEEPPADIKRFLDLGSTVAVSP